MRGMETVVNHVTTTPSLLIILDINGTLLSRLTKSHEQKLAMAHPLSRNPDVSVNGFPIYFRPGLRSFLSSLFRLGHGQHQVAIWTSAMAKNAVPMVAKMFGPLLDYETMHAAWHKEGNGESFELAKLLDSHFNQRISQKKPLEFNQNDSQKLEDLSDSLAATSISVEKKRLAFLWSQSQCEIFNKARNRSGSYSPKPEFRKDLTRVWSSSLFKDQQYSPLNTLIIDDSPEKIDLHPLNHIHVSTFSVAVDPSVDFTTDTELDRLLVHLQKMVQAMEANPKKFDVREFNRINSF